MLNNSSNTANALKLQQQSSKRELNLKTTAQTHPWKAAATSRTAWRSRRRRRLCCWSVWGVAARWTVRGTAPTCTPDRSGSSPQRCVWSGRRRSPQSWGREEAESKYQEDMEEVKVEEQGHEEGYMQEKRAQMGKDQGKGRDTLVRSLYKYYFPIRDYWVVGFFFLYFSFYAFPQI